MAEFFPTLTDDHRAFIARQPVFFVATAAAGGRINLSPKGMDTFRVFGADTVAYLDLGGSGNETQAHLAADGRITIMFCAFDNPALILRLYGRGRFVVAGDAGYADLARHFPPLPGQRQVFDVPADCRSGGGAARQSAKRALIAASALSGSKSPTTITVVLAGTYSRCQKARSDWPVAACSASVVPIGRRWA